MKLLSSLVEQYRLSPNDDLKKEIFDRIIYLDDVSILDNSESIKPRDEWTVFDSNIRLKEIYPKMYLIADVFSLPTGGYICYSYKINLNLYSSKMIKEYESFFLNYRNVSADKNIFSAFSIAKSFDAAKSMTPYFAEDEIRLEAWYKKL